MKVNYTLEYEITYCLLIEWVFADMSGAYSHKSSLEEEMPGSAEWLRTAYECLVDCLRGVASATGKFAIIIISVVLRSHTISYKKS